METLLEQQRRYHEERERLLDAMVGENLVKKTTHRENLNSEHRQRAMLDRYSEATNLLREIYEDKDGQRKEEVQALSGPNEFAEFYARLKQIKDFHRRHPGEAISVPMSVEFEELKKIRETGGDNEAAAVAMVDFSEEESYGRYLDLHNCHRKYINLKGVERVDYLSYLSIFDRLYETVPKARKSAADYRAYLNELLEYLHDFTQRIRPLMDVSEEMSQVAKEFNAKYDAGEFPGWPPKERPGGAMAKHSSGAHLDLSAFSSPEELASLGLDRLKSALMALSLKCGGTLEDRANRLFSTKGKRLNELDPSLFAKNKGKSSGGGAAGGGGLNAKEVAKQRETAYLEAQVYKFSELLSEVRAATKENVERKQARTELERDDSDNELSDDEAGGGGGDDEDDIPYNPKNLPLGWDGKPIPYWLYKLHGLNISYKCEICGNFTYKGPKAFQRHFAEWRHAHGMRCLGIPNTAHFANVTQIEDAMALWEKLKQQKQDEAWKPEQEEEFEDSQGNVVNKKIYEDLKRQGLL